MKATHKILRQLVMLLSAAAALFYFLAAYFGFSLARAFHAQWLFTNWSTDAVNAIQGVLFTATFLAVGFRRTWSRHVAALSFGASLVWTIYDALEYTFHWTHLVMGVLEVLGLLWAISKESTLNITEVRASA